MEAILDLLTAHQKTAIPALVILYISMILINMLVGLSIVKQSRQKFMTIWITSLVLSLVVLIALIAMPNMTQSIVNFFGGAK